MAEKNTPLINELLIQVAQHSEFETWRQKGKHPTGIVKELCEPLKTDPRFMGQPGRFYTSATVSVNYIYKSWFALMKRYQSQLDGKLRWLEMLNSDAELVEQSGVSLDTLRATSAEILAQFKPQETNGNTPTKGKKSKKRKKSENVDKVTKTKYSKGFPLMDVTGFEPVTPSMSTMYSNQLSYTSLTTVIPIVSHIFVRSTTKSEKRQKLFTIFTPPRTFYHFQQTPQHKIRRSPPRILMSDTAIA